MIRGKGMGLRRRRGKVAIALVALAQGMSSPSGHHGSGVFLGAQNGPFRPTTWGFTIQNLDVVLDVPQFCLLVYVPHPTIDIQLAQA